MLAGLEFGQLVPFDLALLRLFETADAAHLVHARETQRPAFLIGATRAADAVHVHFRVRRHVDVDHRFELRDVETARGDVGGDQHRAAAVGELDQHLIAFTLIEFAVQRERMKTLRAQHVEQIAALLLGVAERERAHRTVVVQQQTDGVQPLVFGHFVEALANLGVVVPLFELHFLRVAQELLAQLDDAFGVRRREQQRLPLFRALLHDRRDVVEETHVEHAVGFVEHQRVERLRAAGCRARGGP